MIKYDEDQLFEQWSKDLGIPKDVCENAWDYHVEIGKMRDLLASDQPDINRVELRARLRAYEAELEKITALVEPGKNAETVRAYHAAADNLVGNDRRNLLALAMKLEDTRTMKQIFLELQPWGGGNKDPERHARAWIENGKRIAKELGLPAPCSDQD